MVSGFLFPIFWTDFQARTTHRRSVGCLERNSKTLAWTKALWLVFNIKRSHFTPEFRFQLVTCNDAIENRVFLDTAALGVFYTIAFVALAIVVKFVRRKFVLNFTLLISCAAGFLLPNIAERNLILACYFAFVIFAGINVSVINSVACDSIPTHLR